MKKNFSETLKELRISAGFTQKQVYEKLGVPQSTFSSWEIGKAEPSASMTLRLCEIYGVKDILYAFGYDGYNKDGSIQLNISEVNLIEKYRGLDDYGRKTVDLILEREAERQETLKKRLLTYEKELKKVQGHNYRNLNMVAESPVEYGANATHERTDIDTTAETQRHDDNIMNDKNI